jgi:hypothetical protein
VRAFRPARVSRFPRDRDRGLGTATAPWDAPGWADKGKAAYKRSRLHSNWEVHVLLLVFRWLDMRRELGMGLVQDPAKGGQKLAPHTDTAAVASATPVLGSSDHDPNGYRPSDASPLGRHLRQHWSSDGWHLHQSIQSVMLSYSSLRELLLLFKVP